MKIQIYRDPLGEATPLVVEADLVFYASDGDENLYVHLYTEHWVRVGGHHFAAGRWDRVAEVAPAEERLAGRWVKGQNGLADDPDKVPGKV